MDSIFSKFITTSQPHATSLWWHHLGSAACITWRLQILDLFDQAKCLISFTQMEKSATLQWRNKEVKLLGLLLLSQPAAALSYVSFFIFLPPHVAVLLSRHCNWAFGLGIFLPFIRTLTEVELRTVSTAAYCWK